MLSKTNYRWKTPQRLQIKTPTQQQIVALSQMMIRADSSKRRPVRIKPSDSEITPKINVESSTQLTSVPLIQNKIDSEVLVLKNSQITSMKGLNEYKNLNYIDLSVNIIKEISDINTTKLTALIVSYNKIKELKNLPETLKILDAKSNVINKCDISNLKNLKVLNLNNNNLTLFNFGGLTVIQKIYLDENKISYMTDLPLMIKLTHLSVSNNQLIKIFDSKTLCKIPSIKFINFQGNPLTRTVLHENYLDVLQDCPIPPQRLRCKSVETHQNLKLDTSETYILKEQKLNIFDFTENTPLPPPQNNKYSFNQQLISRIIKKSSIIDNYRTELNQSQQGKREKFINQFSIKPAQINVIPDFQFIKRVNKKSKTDIFTQDEILRIQRIKTQYKNQQPIMDYVYKYFPLSQCVICYGNPTNIDQLDVDSLIIKYYNLNQLTLCNLLLFNQITKLTLIHNNIHQLYQLQQIRPYFQKLNYLQIEKNSITQCSILKQYINNLFNLDEKDKRLFSKFNELQIQEDIEVDESLIPKINYNKFDYYFYQYIQQVIEFSQ